MAAHIQVCASRMEVLQNLRSELVQEQYHWSDAIRLILRCEIFENLVQAMTSTPQMFDEADETELNLLREMAKLLAEVQGYVEEFKSRDHYQGMTEPSFRQGCAADFAKLNEKIIKLAQALNIIDEVDYDERRNEDLEDQRNSFKTAFVKILDEVSLCDSSKYEINFINLKKNIESYPATLGKFLALNKHMALTVAETKQVKSDADWMKALWEEKYQPMQRSHSNNTDSPAESSEDVFDQSFRHSYHHTMDTEFVAKLVENDRLNNDQLSIRLKLLSELKLPQEDVLVSSVKIGQGGFGEVFLGNYKRRFKVAIKTIRNIDDPQADIKRRSIENELLLMKYLGAYPTVLSCYGYVMNGSCMQIVLELAPYGSLDKLIRDQNYQSFPPSLTMAWLCDLADALKFLHSKNIKHRDIKAENMLVFDKLQIKLCDFGPAKHHLSEVTAESRVGTFCFMAPEIRVGKVSELASDVFSFAMTAIQIISRRNPRIDNFKGQIAEALTHFNIPDISIIKRLTFLFTACVAYDPHVSPSKVRPTSAEVAEELLELLEGELGGDPREEGHEMYEDIKQLESVIKSRAIEKQQQAQQQARGSSRNAFFRPQSANMSMSLKRQQYPQFSSSSRLDDANAPPMVSAAFSMGNSLIYPNANVPLVIPEAEEKAQIGKFLHYQIGLAANVSQEIATILVRTGVLTVDILRRRLYRNPDLLLDLGIEEEHVIQIIEYFLQYAPEEKTNNMSMNNLNNFNSNSSDNINNSNRNSLNLNNVSNNDMNNNRYSYNPPIMHNPMNNNSHSQNTSNDDSGSVSHMSIRSHQSFSPMNGQGFSSNYNNRLSSSHSMMSMNSTSNHSIQRLQMITNRNSMQSMHSMVSLTTSGDSLNSARLPSEISRLYYEASQCNNTEALDSLRELVFKGSKLAECFMMRMYALGQGGVAKETELAVEMGSRLYPWLQEMVVRIGGQHDLGRMYIKYLIGVCYSEGLGISMDKKESIRWYRMSADEGYSAAQAYLGTCYFSGLGVNKSYAEAVKYYKLAADQGYAGAQCNLGLCYEHGYDVEREPKTAFRWYSCSASQGDAAGAFNLGYCYERGFGTEQNWEKAVHYYRESAKRGYTAAQYNLGVCYYFGNGVEQDIEEAVQCFTASANKGHPPAQCKLGLCYENGHGVQQDFKEAVYWYQQAAEKGDAAAQYYLGFCYFSGIGVDRDPEEAIKYYKISAARNYPPAHNNLGFSYFNGIGVPKNYHLAVKHYKIAADHGYGPALYNMGYCYEHGYGVAKKLNMVLRYYRLAAENGSEKAKQSLLKYQS